MGKPLRALLVEDNEADSLLVLRELERGGFRVAHHRVESEAELRAALTHQQWDVVLSDFSLPGFNAPAALRVVQSTGLDLPFIIVSGTVGEEIAVESMRAGAQDYVLKTRLTRLCAVVSRELREVEERSRRRQAERSLEQSERRYRDLVETLQEGVWVFDAVGRTIYVNPRMAQMLGYAAADMLGTELASYLDEAGAQQAPLFLERRKAGVREQQDFVLLHKDGRRVHVALAVGALLDDKGNSVGTVGGVMDLTDRRKLEEQLRVAQRMEAVGQLAGGVAHDFNNVLAVILSHLGFLLDGCTDAQAGEDLRTIEKAARHAESLTRQLLAFSRRQIQKLELLDLKETVAEVGKMLRRLIGENIKLVTVADDGLWPVKADRGQIEQVLMNLALNARDAMPTGGKLTIEIANAELGEDYAASHPEVPAGHYVRLVVTDTGLGIPSDVRPRIFEPFFTTKGQGKGTGLGLATVWGIVSQSHGHVWVYSEPGEGTSFKIYLPRAEGEAAPAAKPARTSRAPTNEATVLVVEDAEPVRRALTRILSRQGYRVLEASHGAEAVEICQQHEGALDLMITDIVMPGMSVRELAKRAAALRPGLRVLFMSGYTDNAIVHGGVLDAGTAFLEKPFTAESVLSKVEEVLSGAKAGEGA